MGIIPFINLNLSPTMSGAVGGGTALVKVGSTLSGGGVGGGTALTRQRLTYVADGGEVLTGGAALTDYAFYFNLELIWQTRAEVIIDKSFVWDTGQLPLRYYQVQGCCEFPTAAGSGDPGVLESLPNPPLPGGCEVTGIQTDDSQCVGALGKQQFIQTIAATSVADVCRQLKNSKQRWQICSLKRWSRPADNSLVSEDDQCNVLSEVPLCDIPDCLDFCLESDNTIHMKITTSVIESLNVYIGSGGAITGGEAITSLSTGTPDTGLFQYVGSGGAITGGEALTSSSWESELLTTMEIAATVENIEAVFSAGAEAPAFELSAQTIGTACGTCDSMPLVLYMHHNIVNDSVFNNFLKRNGLEMTSPLAMHYSSRLQKWVANYHLVGVSDDNRGGNESWRFSFEWSCLSDIGGEDLGSASWKFSMLAVRKLEMSGFDLDTRVMIVFPPDQICAGIQNLGFDFSFNLNTVTNYVSNDLDIVASTVLLTDKIGLFKSKFWTQNPDYITRLSKSDVSNSVQRQDIRPIFPEAEPITIQG